ncbi:A-deaminase domain-containing protein [Sulfidibacter corallicola]|uniref:Adenosine deaminase domain-containing protein n=1 Tax=Sulfidibacter corallicola TaxID=2818388 RepID=A0A8A4TVM2_SULCO|nr:hypothetical protein [Sulfidibacter corallicola]QTD54006.1 hypothetical protein J3U87_16290 [Sulfidibacter corallicola]
MNFETFRSIGKAELHVHLEGSFRMERARELASAKPDHPWNGLAAEALRRRFKTSSFVEFLEQFMSGYRLLKTRDHFQMVTEDLCAEFERQGVQYAEVLYSPGVYVQKLHRELVDIHEGIGAALAQFPKLRVSFILDTVLNMGLPFMSRTLEMVLHDRPEYVRGFSVGGGQPDLDMAQFLPLFERAQEAGLFVVAHAGEVDGPENIRTLIEHTDIRRIAHGCSAARDPELCRELAGRQIAIDVSLSSNLCTGTVTNLKRHPIFKFLEYGIPVTLNTDDPFYFQTDLFNEYQLAEDIGISWDKLLEIMAFGLEFR